MTVYHKMIQETVLWLFLTDQQFFPNCSFVQLFCLCCLWESNTIFCTLDIFEKIDSTLYFDIFDIFQLIYDTPFYKQTIFVLRFAQLILRKFIKIARKNQRTYCHNKILWQLHLMIMFVCA